MMDTQEFWTYVYDALTYIQDYRFENAHTALEIASNLEEAPQRGRKQVFGAMPVVLGLQSFTEQVHGTKRGWHMVEQMVRSVEKSPLFTEAKRKIKRFGTV